MTNASLVFGVVAFILIYWPTRLFLRPIFKLFRKRTALQQLAREGTPIEGEIVQSQYVGKVLSNGSRRIRIKVAFNNFVGTLIQEEFRFFDTRPQQQRYALGKMLQLMMGDKTIVGKKVAIAGSQNKINLKLIAIYLGLLIITVGCLYTFFVWPIWKKGGQSLEATLAFLDSAKLKSPILLTAGIGLVNFLFFHFIDYVTGKTPNQDEFKYHGKQAQATVTRYEKTGVRVNKNPQVKFSIAFTTDEGQRIKTSVKRVIDELAIGRIHEMTHFDVLYLPNRPDKVCLHEDVHKVVKRDGYKIVPQATLFIISFIILHLVLLEV
ncbi:MAG TPA: hypothetical protein DCS93_14825 [Microscillaceae bacterium]|nr:hypothetical protein [Microscillaceae bacterium]